LILKKKDNYNIIKLYGVKHVDVQISLGVNIIN